MKKVLALILAVMMLAALLTSCGKAAAPAQTAPLPVTTPAESAEPGAAPAPTSIETLIIGTAADLETPSRSVYNFDVYSGTLSQLAPVYIDENANVQPLATEFATSDYKTWTLTVVDGLTWHDGVPVTAEDIKFTIEYNALQSTGEPQTTYAEINVIDERTVELVLPSANVRHLSGLTTLRLMPKHIFEGIEDMTTATTEQMTIGCGPYEFADYNADARTYTFVANENFIWGKPNVETVIFRTFGSVDTLNLALKAGEIDMVYAYAGGVGAAAAEDFKTAANVSLFPVKDTSNTAVLVFNNNTAPASDINFRKAVAFAIDYDKFRELFGSEYSARSTAGFVPSGTFGYIDTPELVRDLDKAREYLTALGVSDADGDGIVELGGKPLTLELMVRSDIPVYERYAELLKANLAEVGIELTLNITDVPSFREITEQTHTNQAMVTKFTAFGMAMQAGMGTAYMSGLGASNGQGQIMDETFDAIVQRLKTAATPEEYLKAAAECQQYYAENTPAIALFRDSYIQAYNSSLGGFTVDGTFGILNARTWYSVTKK
ncbi:MAG: ABC transporter substrate-binding protein [Oscillospiraceae bacterium]|jgi:peptide/nickel transport system substrate-binding protein|nr:ABC transporter substrate-binding protein [Oscillospiraceae bacterium]